MWEDFHYNVAHIRSNAFHVKYLWHTLSETHDKTTICLSSTITAVDPDELIRRAINHFLLDYQNKPPAHS